MKFLLLVCSELLLIFFLAVEILCSCYDTEKDTLAFTKVDSFLPDKIYYQGCLKSFLQITKWHGPEVYLAFIINLKLIQMVNFISMFVKLLEFPVAFISLSNNFLEELFSCLLHGTLTIFVPFQVIYFGDHLFSDLRGPSKAGWRTAAIIHELEVCLMFFS